MATLEWDKDENGELNFLPYVGHRTATLSDQIVVVRLAFVSSPDQHDTEAHGLQLALSRDQARELGQGLLSLAELPHIPRPPSGARH
jgi:hypothetical protein